MTIRMGGVLGRSGILGLFVLLLALLSSCALVQVADADRGGFSPTWERVSESGQRAIIAWNGSVEMLFLSTDVSSSRESEVVEIMPFPANPAIGKAEASAFLNVQELVNTYFYLTSRRAHGFWYSQSLGLRDELGQDAPKVEITFQEIIGVHYLTVVRAEEAEELVSWLKEFLRSKGYSVQIRPDLDELLENYTQSKMNFFAIDVIKTNSTVKTVDPLVYEFSSSRLCYPLRISSLFSGDTDMSIFTMTSNELKDDSVLGRRLVKRAQFQIKQEKTVDINANITKLFSSNPYLCYFRFTGPLNSFNEDLLAESQSGINSAAVALAAVNLFWGLMLLFLFFPSRACLHLKNAYSSMIRRLEVTSMLTGLAGVFLVLVGSTLPWGLVEITQAGGLLLPVSGIPAAFSKEITNFLLMSFLLTAVCSYAYLLLSHGHSKSASATLAAAGASAMFIVLVSGVFFYSLDIGFFATLTGCAFIVLAGLLSFWRMKLNPPQPVTTEFKAYLIRTFLRFVVTLIGVTWVVFGIYYILPVEIRILFGFLMPSIL